MDGRAVVEIDALGLGLNLRIGRQPGERIEVLQDGAEPADIGIELGVLIELQLVYNPAGQFERGQDLHLVLDRSLIGWQTGENCCRILHTVLPLIEHDHCGPRVERRQLQHDDGHPRHDSRGGAEDDLAPDADNAQEVQQIEAAFLADRHFALLFGEGGFCG